VVADAEYGLTFISQESFPQMGVERYDFSGLLTFGRLDSKQELKQLDARLRVEDEIKPEEDEAVLHRVFEDLPIARRVVVLLIVFLCCGKS